MDSVSRLSESACGSFSDAPRVFCVVCGTINDDMVLRRSGLKCRGCVGKSSNRRYVKLQKKQAKHFLSQTFSARSSSAGLDANSFVPSGDGLQEAHPMSSSLSSSGLPRPEDYSSRTAMPKTKTSALHPIEEYISGTSVYRTAVRHVCPGARGANNADGSCSGDQETLLEGAGSVTRSTSETLSKDQRESSLAHGSYLSSCSVTGDTLTRASAPVALSSTNGSTQHQKVGSRNDGTHGADLLANRGYPEALSGVTRVRGVDRCSCLSTGANHAPCESLTSRKAAPFRLPPRNRSHAKQDPFIPARSGVDTKGSEEWAAPIQHSGGAGGTENPNTKAASPSQPLAVSSATAPAPTTKLTSTTVRCVLDEDVISESWSGACSRGAAFSVEPSDPYLSHPHTPHNGVATSPALSVNRHIANASPMRLGEAQCTATLSLLASQETILDPPAPRAGSGLNSSASSAFDCTINARLTAAKSRAKSSTNTQQQRESSPSRHCSDSVARLADSLAGVSMPHVDPHEALNRGAYSLLRMPHARTAPALNSSAHSSCSSDSESSCSEGIFDGTPKSSQPVVTSSDSPAAVTGVLAAVAGGAVTAKARPTSASDASVAVVKGERGHKRKMEATQPGNAERSEISGKNSASHGVAANRIRSSIDALRITVEQVAPAQTVSEASVSPSRGGDGSLLVGVSSNDENSAVSGDTRSRSDSARSISSRAQDGYQRHVYVVGQTGRFTVTRHTRQPSGGSDLLASGKSKGTLHRSRRKHNTAGEAVGVGTQEVKRIMYSLVLHHRNTNEVLLTQRRRLYADIIPALERVKTAAGARLPAMPMRRLPSLRFATDAFIEERRSEVEVFLQAVSQSPAHIRHPDIVSLLGLGPYLRDAAGASASGRRRDATSTRCFHRSSGTVGNGMAPRSDGGSSPEPRQGGRADVGTASPQFYNCATSGGADVSGAAVVCGPDDTGFGNVVRGDLTEGALKAYRASAAEDVGGIDGSGRFSRTLSYCSMQTTTSSVMRRRKLDDVTMEDLEHIQLGNLIARGTFGAVYLGLVQTHRGPLMVAVKVMTMSESVTPAEVESLQRELDVLCTAQHKNIIRFLGSLLNPATRELRVFTEYMECGTIHSLVHRFGALTMLAIQQYMRQILSGLCYLHSLSIAHRDIKGDNILITKNGRVKLSDFGSSTGMPCNASAAADAGTPSSSEDGSGGLGGCISGDGALVGSPQYMAPEVIQGTVKSHTAADMWSLGCVGIEMMDRAIWKESANKNPYVFLYRISRSGTPPHGLPTDAELTALTAEGKPKEYEGFSLYLDFLQGCLCVNPEQRKTASELLNHPFITYPYSKHLRWMPPATAKPSSPNPS